MKRREEKYILNMVERDSINGQKIYKFIRRTMDDSFVGLLAVCVYILIKAIFLDWYSPGKESLYGCIAEILRCLGNDFYETVRNIKYAVSENIEKFYDTLITINTILAATVIFYYSVQDNKKEGVPHRAILAYSSGSFTIPVYFLFASFLLPVGFWALHFGMRVTFIASIIISYILQMTNIILILASTSHSYGLSIICNAEIRQYRALCNIKEEKKPNQKNDPQFIWTYLMHHLEQVVMSDELVADKMTLVRELLKTPYYEKEMTLWEKRQRRKSRIDDMSAECLKKNDLKRIYEFYYGNLSAVMEYLNKKENSSERNKIYLVLYEFLGNLQYLYLRAGESSEAMQNYMMAVAGMMNAVLDSRTPEAEGFCNYVLNECIENEKVRRRQIGLYFLFQEYLFRIDTNDEDDNRVVFMNQIGGIRDIEKWFMNPVDEKIYYDFWQIWMDWTTISEKNRRNYFKDAMAALRRESYHSCPVGYIMLLIKNMERQR